MAMRHQNVWDDVGDERFGYGRPPPARGGGRPGERPQPSGASRRPARPTPAGAGAASPFAGETVEAKLSLSLAELLLKRGVTAAALQGSGMDVVALSQAEPRGSRFQRLTRIATLPAGGGKSMLPPTARSVEQLALAAELYALEQEAAARLQLEAQSAMRLRQAAANAERLRAQFERLLAERDHPTRNTERQRAYMREHVRKLRDRHDSLMEAIGAGAARPAGAATAGALPAPPPQGGTDAATLDGSAAASPAAIEPAMDAADAPAAEPPFAGESAEDTIAPPPLAATTALPSKPHPLDVDVFQFVAEQSALCDKQHALVQALIDKVDGYLQGSDSQRGLLPSGGLALFGSRATKLSLASSDVDLVLQGELTDAMQRSGGARSVIAALVERLRADHPDVKFIDAAIPRCTFVDKHSGLTADITAGPSLLHRPGSAPLQHSGELASAFVRRLQLDYPPLRPLVLILKALLRRAHYHEPFMGGLSSHGLVMMVGTLLRVREREQGAYAVRGVPLSVLLCEFLFVFGFEFDYGRLGISLRRGDFFDRVEIGDYAAPLLIEDPLAEAPEDGTVVNVTHVVTSTQLLQGVFRAAYSLLTAPKHTSLSLMASLDY